MLTINQLSRIGFGSYRVSVRSQEHADVLRHALQSGCNLIDTSSNYMDGESELLIGKVLKENSALDAFVITKAGYAQGNNLTFLHELNSRGIAREDVVVIDENMRHSIHPDFLDAMLDQSLERLQKQTIDCFLLHNPEYYFDQHTATTSRAAYYSRIKKAFEYLEGEVQEGRIRYYGISSNTFPLSTDLESTTDLNKLLQVAKEVSGNHHFKFIQFPFNLVENDALKSHYGNQSLLKVARENGIITLGNRPLNANLEGTGMRLAGYPGAKWALDERKDRKWFEESLRLIEKQMKVQELDHDAREFTIIKYLEDNWKTINSTDAAEHLFAGYFYPLLNELYAGKIPPDELTVYRSLYETASLYARKTMNDKALAFRAQMMAKGVLHPEDQRPLQVQACDRYLKAGIDHVLVGMKRKVYVDEMKELF